MEYVFPRQNPMKTRIMASQNNNFFSQMLLRLLLKTTRGKMQSSTCQYLKVSVHIHTHPGFFYISGNKKACEAQLIETSKV